MNYLVLTITGIMMSGLMTTTIAMTDSGTVQESENQNVTLDLQLAGEIIEDPELKAYYDTLLEEIGPQESEPDIEKIVYESLTTPYQQAGLQIEGPQLKAFYYRFIGDIGLDK